jgi:hypothetical protein
MQPAYDRPTIEFWQLQQNTGRGMCGFLAQSLEERQPLIVISIQRLPDEWKAAYPEMDWRRIADFRNVLAHQYLDIDLEIVWNVIENYLPDLKNTVEVMTQEFWNP